MSELLLDSRSTIAPIHRDIWGLAAVAAGPSAWGSILMAARLAGADPGPWTVQAAAALSASCTLAGGVWLLTLIVNRSGGRPRSRGPVLQVLAAGGITLADLVDRMAHLTPNGNSADLRLASAVLLVWLTREVLLRRGITLSDLGIGSAGDRSPMGRLNGWAVGVQATAVIITAGYVVTLLSLYAPGPQLQQPQHEVLGVHSDLIHTTRSLWTSVAEEMVLTGAVVALLSAARRPVWQWVAIPVALRLIPHLYLGVPGLATAITAAGVVYLYARHRRVTPLIAAHFLYNWQLIDLLSRMTPTMPSRTAAICAVLAAAAAAYAVQQRFLAISTSQVWRQPPPSPTDRSLAQPAGLPYEAGRRDFRQPYGRAPRWNRAVQRNGSPKEGDSGGSSRMRRSSTSVRSRKMRRRDSGV